MKTNRNNGQRSAFTLIEMVGVLAVIAILAALLVPKIFAAINDSRINGTVSACNVAKTATMTYFGKTGTLGTGLDADFGDKLVTSGALEETFATKIGTAAIKAAAGVSAVTAPVATTGAAFELDGNATTGANDAIGAAVVYVEITGVSMKDAWEISNRIDGIGVTGVDESAPGAGDAIVASGKSETDATTADIRGRVKYAAGAPTTTVYVYLAAK
jgi:prepilin-type N-terminal cleavage/methylation domain-containing protein